MKGLVPGVVNLSGYRSENGEEKLVWLREAAPKEGGVRRTKV